MPGIRNIRSIYFSDPIVSVTRRDFQGALMLTYAMRRTVKFPFDLQTLQLPPVPLDRSVVGEVYHQDPEAAEEAFDLTGYSDGPQSMLVVEFDHPIHKVPYRKVFNPVIFGSYGRAETQGDEIVTLEGPDGGQIIYQVTRFLLAMRINNRISEGYIVTSEIE